MTIRNFNRLYSTSSTSLPEEAIQTTKVVSSSNWDNRFDGLTLFNSRVSVENGFFCDNLTVAQNCDLQTATFHDAVACSSTLGVTGATTLSSTLGVTGATTLSSTLGVTGATTLTGAVACLSTLDVTGAVACLSTLDVTGDVTLSGLLKGPSTFVIDPSAHGDNTGTVVIKGSLTVEGTTTTVNSSVLDVVDKNITIAKGNTVQATADNAGINIELTSSSDVASILYKQADDNFLVNKIIRSAQAPVGVDDLTNKNYVDMSVTNAASLITNNTLDFNLLKGIKFKIISTATTLTDLDTSVPSILYVLNKHTSSVVVTIGDDTLTASVGFSMFVFDPSGSGWTSPV